MQGLISSVGNLESGGGGGGSSLYITYIKSVSSNNFRIISFPSDGTITDLTSLLSFIRTKGLSINLGGTTVKCLPCMCGVVNSQTESFPDVNMLYCEQTGTSLYFANESTHGQIATSNFSYSNVQIT